MRIACGIALLATLAPAAATVDGHAAPPARFCGLARTVNGFDPVSAVDGISCPSARGVIRRVERGRPGPWVCSRAVHALYELDCRTPDAEIEVLERPPVAATRRGDLVTLANWSFRIAGRALQGRSDHGRWQIVIAHPPYCVPDAPREVLAALRLRRITPAGGCYEPR